jgi:hypothetical protein
MAAERPSGAGQEVPAYARYRARHERRRTVAARVGAGLTVLGIALFALVAPAESENRAYEAARTCPAGTRSDTCRVVAEATVRDKEADTGGKSTKDYLVLRDRASGAEHRVRMRSGSAVFDAARLGDRVTVTYWKGQAREVRLGRLSSTVRLSPLHDGRLPAAFAVVTLPVGLGLLWLARSLRRRPDAPGDAMHWSSPVGLMAALFVAGAGFTVVFVAAGDVRSGLEFSAWSVVVAVPLSMLLCWWSVRRVRRAASRLTPAKPKGRKVVEAIVHGDVSYSRPGFSYFVTGDGPPVSTTDPTGRVATVPLPDTLRVHGVREVRFGDPEFSPPRRGEYVLVLECTDGDRRVLVMTGKRAAPYVLDALGGVRPRTPTP